MSTSTATGVNQSNHSNWARCGSSKANWHPVNIAATVVSFVVFWPIGLLVLFWVLSGRDALELPGVIKDKWQQLRGQFGGFNDSSDNTVFNAFQQTQYDRINEIKDEIKARSERFKAFRADAKRRADEAEFNEFIKQSSNESTER